MSDALERLRESNRYDLKLDNGMKITYRVPFMQDLVIAGLIPLAVVDEVSKRLAEGATEAEADQTAQRRLEERLQEYDQDFAAQRRVVSIMVTGLDDEPVSLNESDAREIRQAAFRYLVRVALRQRLPGETPEEPRAEGEA